MKPVKVEVLACSNCGRIWTDRKAAERCCVCKRCGDVTDSPSNTLCPKCRTEYYAELEREKVEKAEKVPYAEYEGDGVYIDGNYYWDFSPEELRDAWEADNIEPWPGMQAFTVWGVYSEPIALNPDQLADLLNDGAYEDYEVDAEMYADLQRLCDEWNEKHADKVYWPDNVVVVYEEE